MVFSSAIFLFLFLPVVFVLYRLVPGVRAKNYLLILFSLLFYAFGKLSYLPLLLFSVVCNYLAGLAVAQPGKWRKAALVAAVAVNLGLLGCFKYLDFFLENWNRLTGLALPLTGIELPIGISFFTFQGMSYVIDVYRHPESGTRSFSKVLLYISFFPQLVAGPIVKYLDIAQEIDHRTTTPEQTARGFLRFICGLSKKMLLSNALGAAADSVFALSASQLNLPLAWLGAVCYTLQIYFDFSGYSDMAIGLGRMFGFHFLENFNHPYVSGSMKEFWRRWHISLSSWFRDYLYIPLGGNRKGVWRARLNRLVVFFFTGLWHGASWTFVLWGLWHGLFLFLEDLFPRRKRIPALGHLYTLLVVTLGFVLFRADTIGEAGVMLHAMFTGFTATAEQTALLHNLLSPSLVVTLVLSLLCCLPLVEWGRRKLPATPGRWMEGLLWPCSLVLLVLCILSLAAGSFNPFIYFQF
jgi:alginate O-acetyltransferase complex protein AlgI